MQQLQIKIPLIPSGISAELREDWQDAYDLLRSKAKANDREAREFADAKLRALSRCASEQSKMGK